MILDASISILAGLGLFFIGIKGLSTNMSQLAGRSLRRWMARSTDNYALSALVGILSGALTQSTNAITVILMSLASADIIPLNRAKPILAWANVGTAALVFVAAVDLHLAVYTVVGLAGFCTYLNLDRSARWRPAVATLLALGLLFLGLEFMRHGSDEFRGFAWLQELFRESAQWSPAALVIGAALALVVQSSATVTVIAIALASAKLLTFEQVMLTVYGASIGSGLSTYIVAAKIRGASRQLAIFQALVKILGVGLLIPLYCLERGLDIPLLDAGIRRLAASPGHQIALVYLACQIAAVLVQVAFGKVLQPLLDFLSPALPQESLAKPRYLYDQALSDPETALTLVDREEARIFALLPLYLGITEHLEGAEKSLERNAILPIAQALGQSVADFLKDLADTGAERSVLEAVGDRQARLSLLISIHESLAALADQLAQPFQAPALRALGDAIVEGLGALLLTAEEAVRTLAPEDLELMREITRDRDSLVDHLRRRVIEAERGLTATDQRHLYTITSSFELIVWMLRRLTALLAPQVAPALEQRLALEVAPETG